MDILGWRWVSEWVGGFGLGVLMWVCFSGVVVGMVYNRERCVVGEGVSW